MPYKTTIQSSCCPQDRFPEPTYTQYTRCRKSKRGYYTYFAFLCSTLDYLFPDYFFYQGTEWTYFSAEHSTRQTTAGHYLLEVDLMTRTAPPEVVPSPLSNALD